jgi:hypothetical protein
MGVEQVLTGLKNWTHTRTLQGHPLKHKHPIKWEDERELDDMPTGHNTASSTVREHKPEIEARAGSYWNGSMGESGLND